MRLDLFSTKFGCRERRRLEIHLDQFHQTNDPDWEPVACWLAVNSIEGQDPNVPYSNVSPLELTPDR
jgi:hypothetical protein